MIQDVTIYSAPDLKKDWQDRLGPARKAQEIWRKTDLYERLRCVRRLRHLLAATSKEVAQCLCEDRSAAEFLAAQLVPFLDGCRFLEKTAAKLLKPKLHRFSPLWLFATHHEIHREPFGVVLVIGPTNYPFFLPGSQSLQAIVAGNAVLLKPGRNGTRAASFLHESFSRAGFPPGLLSVLPEPEEAAVDAIRQGVDKIVLTGSVATGLQVLAQAAASLTPCTMELSGCDAVFVLPDADLRLAARSVAYGLRLNAGRTCIAPRRIFVWQEVQATFQQRLREAFDGQPVRLVSDPELTEFGGSALYMDTIESHGDALQKYAACPYRLGASIFTADPKHAQALAADLDAGSICINDLIVPTADGRLPFGGRGRSGFGVTRGAEGLIEMTRPKVISTRRAAFRPHLSPKYATDFSKLSRLARLCYASWPERWKAMIHGDKHE